MKDHCIWLWPGIITVFTQTTRESLTSSSDQPIRRRLITICDDHDFRSWDCRNVCYRCKPHCPGVKSFGTEFPNGLIIICMPLSISAQCVITDNWWFFQTVVVYGEFVIWWTFLVITLKIRLLVKSISSIVYCKTIINNFQSNCFCHISYLCDI